YLEVKDAQGRWRRLADVPFPSGKNKTVIVDLTGKFVGADHRMRIRTNMEIYWDQAFVAAARARTSSSITVLDPATADLHYRGFSRLYRKGGRYAPEWAAYEDLSRESPWEPIVGRFTRYGDVLPLVRAPDDMYVIMAPGDETTLTFDASAAPPLPPGWTRDFLLYTDAWLKDSDRNTAMGGTVAPLPFHGMSRYPYGSDEAYPTGAILASIALFLMPTSSALWMAAGLLWILDASINISMEPFRAFVADKLDVSQRTAGFVLQSFFIGVGASLANALPLLFSWFGVQGSTSIGVPLS